MEAEMVHCPSSEVPKLMADCKQTQNLYSECERTGRNKISGGGESEMVAEIRPTEHIVLHVMCP